MCSSSKQNVQYICPGCHETVTNTDKNQSPWNHKSLVARSSKSIPLHIFWVLQTVICLWWKHHNTGNSPRTATCNMCLESSLNFALLRVCFQEFSVWFRPDIAHNLPVWMFPPGGFSADRHSCSFAPAKTLNLHCISPINRPFVLFMCFRERTSGSKRQRGRKGARGREVERERERERKQILKTWTSRGKREVL